MIEPEDTDPLRDLDRELREKVSGEFRRTAEEDEYTARKAALRSRDLAQVTYELMSRGDTISVTIGSLIVRGTVTHARATLATVTSAEGVETHLNLAGPISISVVSRSTAGGTSRQPFGPETFVARLRELELNETPVEVALSFTQDRPTGTIEAVGPDHVMVVGEETHFIPLAWIGAVRRGIR